MPRLISADVLDSRVNDWTITDDGRDRGPTDSWPAPVLKGGDRNPALGPIPEKSRLTRLGLPDAYAFLRQPVPTVPLEDDYLPCVPTSDAMGVVDTVRIPSADAHFGGIDVYEAGMLIRFINRTDAGALDSWVRLTGKEVRGILDCAYCDAGMLMNAGILFDAGLLDDAGMPAGWYDFFSQKENVIIDYLKKVGGNRFSPAYEKKIRDGFVGIRSHATDKSKWDHFNKAKPATFQILEAVQGGPKYVWNRPSTDSQKFLQNIWGQLENHVNSQGKGFIASIGSAIGSGVSTVGKGLGSVGKGVISVGKGIATPVAALVTSPIKLAGDIAKGKNVFESLKDTVKRDLSSVKEIAPYAQTVISFVPGIGQGVNAAIAAGSAIAQGQPITSALVAGVKNALPGGPIAKQAFDTAYDVARGKNISDAALDTLRSQIPGGEVAKKAFDTAVAVAKGQNIQQAAIGVVKTASTLAVLPGVPGEAVIAKTATDLAQGKSLTESAVESLGKGAMHFTKKLSPFATGPMNNTGPRIVDTIKRELLPTLLSPEVKRVAEALLNTPTLRSLSIPDLAQRMNVSQNTARAGMASVLQSVVRSGGSGIPKLAVAPGIESRLPFRATFDQAMANVASRAAPVSYSHNANVSPAKAAMLRSQARVFSNLQARGLDAGALDPKSMPTIRQGSTGEPVKQWQKIIGVTADGQFGPQTTAATKAFQTKKGLIADGIVGPKSWMAGLGEVITTTPPGMPGTPVTPPPSSTPILTKAMPTIKRGSTGAEVKIWQGYLAIPIDGIFGPQTEAATKGFQAKNGLVADGIVGPKTWAAAMGGMQPPIVSTPPITLPPLIPGTPPIVLPPVVITEPPPGMPPGLPPIGVPPGMPPAPPPITTSPPGTPPVVLPPKTPPTTGDQKASIVPIVVGLGLLTFFLSGASKRII